MAMRMKKRDPAEIERRGRVVQLQHHELVRARAQARCGHEQGMLRPFRLPVPAEVEAVDPRRALRPPFHGQERIGRSVDGEVHSVKCGRGTGCGTRCLPMEPAECCRLKWQTVGRPASQSLASNLNCAGDTFALIVHACAPWHRTQREARYTEDAHRTM